MKAAVSYVKGALAASYVSASAAVSYTKAVIAYVYSATAEGLEAALASTAGFSETGFLFTQDYVDDTYFEEIGYIADDARSF